MLPELKKFINFKNPLFRFGLFMLVFSIISLCDLLFFSKNSNVRFQYIFSYILAILIPMPLFFIAKWKCNFNATNPTNFLVTSIIVFLLVHPSNGIALLLLTIVLAWLGKMLFRNQGISVFNPAALGLLLSYYLTELLSKFGLLKSSLLISWWGADIQQKFIENNQIGSIALSVILLAGFMYFADKFKKSIYSASFFLSYIVCTSIYMFTQHSGLSSIFTFTNGFLFDSTAFLALVMLPEPKTSPIFPLQQTAVGIIAGAVLFLCNNVFADKVVEPFVATILIANIFTFFIKYKKILQ